MNNPNQVEKLRSSLKEAIPDPNSMSLDWTALERIDYLVSLLSLPYHLARAVNIGDLQRAVVKESIRLSYGVPGKIPRQVPPGGTTLCEQYIPAGTMLSMCALVYHNHEDYFNRASEFIPERWLGGSAREAETEKSFISFSRGSRNCIGMHLAYAELFYGFAYLFRRFEIVRAHGMSDSDMEWYDTFVVSTVGHLKVNLKRRED